MSDKYKSKTWKKKTQPFILALMVIYHIRQPFPLKYVNFLKAEESNCLRSQYKREIRLKLCFFFKGSDFW